MATKDSVKATAARLGFEVPAGHEDDYLALLQGTDRAVAAIFAEPGAPILSHMSEVKLTRQ